jgi:peroxiredoxin Q/BCP
VQGQGLRDRALDFDTRNVTIFGISFDPVDKNRRFAEKYDFNFKLLSDVDRKVGLAYGATDDPNAKTAARIAYLIGPDGRIEKSFGKVSPRDFTDLALNACAA